MFVLMCNVNIPSACCSSKGRWSLCGIDQIRYDFCCGCRPTICTMSFNVDHPETSPKASRRKPRDTKTKKETCLLCTKSNSLQYVRLHPSLTSMYSTLTAAFAPSHGVLLNLLLLNPKPRVGSSPTPLVSVLSPPTYTRCGQYDSNVRSSTHRIYRNVRTPNVRYMV